MRMGKSASVKGSATRTLTVSTNAGCASVMATVDFPVSGQKRYIGYTTPTHDYMTRQVTF